MKALERRLSECGLQMHQSKTKIVYCRDSNRRYDKHYSIVSFDFLGFTFKPKLDQNSKMSEWFTNWLHAVSTKALNSINLKMR